MKKTTILLIATLCIIISAHPQAPKKVLFEQINGVWCGRIPFGDWVIDNYIVPTYPNVIPVFLHRLNSPAKVNDLLTSTIGDSISDVFYVGIPYPSPKGIIDRMKFSDQTNVVIERDEFSNYNTTGKWKEKVINQLAVTAPVAVSITGSYNATTRTVNATVTTNFVAAASGDLRINLWIVEDSVVGSGYGYDQHTYDYGNAQSPFYQVGVDGPGADSIPGYIHRHVLRGAASPAWGTTGIIPSSVSNGQSFSTNYNYTIPSNWNENRIKLVAFVSNYNTDKNNHSVLNAEQNSLLSLTTTGVNNPINHAANILSMHPNPSNGQTTIYFSLENPSPITIEICNLLGQKVHSIQKDIAASGNHTAVFDASKLVGGVYFIILKTTSATSTKKLIITTNSK